MQALPSLSAALMMLCRATAVSSWQVCKWEPQQTALGLDRRNAKNKTEGEETGCTVRRWNEYPHKILLPELPQTWTQYSIENFPSTPGHQHKWDIDVGPTPEPNSLTHSKTSGDFMQHYGKNAWTRTRLESFPETGHCQCVLKVNSVHVCCADKMPQRLFPAWIRSRTKEHFYKIPSLKIGSLCGLPASFFFCMHCIVGLYIHKSKYFDQ